MLEIDCVPWLQLYWFWKRPLSLAEIYRLQVMKEYATEKLIAISRLLGITRIREFVLGKA